MAVRKQDSGKAKAENPLEEFLARTPGGEGGATQAKSDGFPYSYGSGLHWLWAWGSTLEEWSSRGLNGAGKSDWMLIRPCWPAKNAMMEFSIDYAFLIKEISKLQKQVEDHWKKALIDSSDETLASYEKAIFDLCRRVSKACELIAAAEAKAAPKLSDANETKLPIVSRTKAGDFIEWDNTKYPVSEGWALAFKAMLDAEGRPTGLTKHIKHTRDALKSLAAKSQPLHALVVKADGNSGYYLAVF